MILLGILGIAIVTIAIMFIVFSKIDEYVLRKQFEEPNDVISMIHKWRITFDVPVRDTLMWASNAERNLTIGLIEEEFNELKDALARRDIKAVQDAIGDLYFVVEQMACIHGINSRNVVKQVYHSNMSKLCSSLKEVEQSIKKYEQESVEVEYKPIITENGTLYVLRRKSDKKVLKSINFVEPEFDGFVEYTD